LSLKMWDLLLLPLVLLFAAASGRSVPSNDYPSSSSYPQLSSYSRCDISGAKIYLPPHQTALSQPKEPPSFIAVAFGTQNYSCVNGKYAYVPAVPFFNVSFD
jgi:hypothetical protein